MSRTVHKNETYKGEIIHNEQIISLNQELNDALMEIKRIQFEIEEFQKNCNHEYYFICAGMYDDSYECIHCGHIDYF